MTVPAGLDLQEVQGDDWLITCNVVDVNGYAVDLSGSTYVAKIKRSKTNSSAVASFTIDATNLALGTFVLSLSAAESSLLTARHYYYDIQQESFAGFKTTIVAGKITMIKEVTT